MNETQKNLRYGRNIEEKEQKGEEQYIFAWKGKERITLLVYLQFISAPPSDSCNMTN